jgi:hypothetical protein
LSFFLLPSLWSFLNHKLLCVLLSSNNNWGACHQEQGFKKKMADKPKLLYGITHLLLSNVRGRRCWIWYCCFWQGCEIPTRWWALEGAWDGCALVLFSLRLRCPLTSLTMSVSFRKPSGFKFCVCGGFRVQYPCNWETWDWFSIQPLGLTSCCSAMLCLPFVI